MLDRYKNWLGDKVWYKNWKAWLSIFVVFGVASSFLDDEELDDGISESKTEAVADAKEEPEEASEKDKEEAEEIKEEPSKEEPSKEKKLPKGIQDLRLTDVRDDKTGRWKKVVDSKNFDMPENVIDYYEEYMEDKEVHFLISFSTNTTTMISDIGGMLYVDITEYEKKEEHSADTIGNGMTYKSYNVYKHDGEIEEIDDVEE